MSSKVIYFAHEGVDHSTGASHAESNETVNAVSIFIAVTIVAVILLMGALILSKRIWKSSPAKTKGMK